MKTLKPIVLGISLSLGVVGCATQAPLSEQSIQQEYPAVASLQSQLEVAESQELATLSPKYYEDAREAYQSAMQLAKARDPGAEARANYGLNRLEMARQNAERVSDELEYVLDARSKAMTAGANPLNSQRFAKSEKELRRMAGWIEMGQIDRARADRIALQRSYEDIELAALKGDTVEKVKAALAQAERDDLEDIAPRTMALAKEEYRLALNTLDADRGDKEKAERHAQRALWHTQRANEIAVIIEDFDNADFTEEDKVLWYQEQVSRLVEPVTAEVQFNRPNKALINSLSNELSGLIATRQNLQSELEVAKTRQEEISRQKEQELLAVQSEKEQERALNQAMLAKFSVVQSMFQPNEADVYRQSDDVLIRAHGFSFPSGGSEIESDNFALVNKIIEAIREFPDAKVVVSGHTDSQGDELSNERLSEDRAAKVARFLTEVGNIPASRISAIGYGEQRPVANNETAEGREANRRVEVLIRNFDNL